MAARRSVTRSSASRGGKSSDSRSKGGSAIKSSYRGAAGRKQMEEEQRRSEARRELAKQKSNQPYRFWVPEGETRQIVVIDEAPDFFRYEHALKDRRSGRYDNYLPCIDEHANCPACKNSDKPSYYGMYLTIIDLTPYENADGDEVEWSKKLLVAKPAQQKKINRLFEKHGTLRGMILDMTRDGKKDAAIGNDIEFADFMPEDELEEYVTEYKDRDGKIHEVIGYEPFDYDDLFPDMSEEEIATLAGGDRSVGNRDEEDRELGRRRVRTGRGRGRDEDEEEEERPRRSASRRARDEEEEEEPPRRSRTARRDEEEDEEEKPARRSSRGSRSEEAPRRAARKARDEEPEDEEEEEEKPARRSTKTATRPARKAREEEPEEEPEEEEEERPRRGARRSRADTEEDPPFEGGKPRSAGANRRAALRGRGR